MEPIFEDPRWCRALTLEERVALLRAHPPRAKDERAAFDAELAREELRIWRAQAPFASGDWFARRLASQGISEEEFLRVLGEPVELVSERLGGPPPFVREIAAAFAEAGPQRWFPPLTEELKASRTLGFLHAVRPILWRGRERLREGAAELARRHPDAPFEPADAADHLCENLPWQIHSMLSRAMVLEMNIARMEGRLAGESAEDRFLAFLDRLLQREHALEFLLQYPVLARSVVETVERFTRFGLEFLGHLCADRAAVEDVLAAREALGRTPDAREATSERLGMLTRVEGGAGDLHRGGRSVLIAEFEGGRKLVYKPRSLAGDVAFGDLCAWLNARGDHPALRAPRVLDRGDHGWVEFEVAHPCAARDEVARFYRRQGGFLALLYFLEGTDFHFENLIAAGEHPILVDLETLLHPHFPLQVGDDPQTVLVSEATSRSVLRIGLLPQRSWAQGEYEGVDISGLAKVGGQLTPEAVLQWDDIATDEMHAVKKRMEMPGGKNQPELADAELHALDFREDIARGFREIYELFRAHRDELLAPNGPIERFARIPMRVVLRATRGYGVLLNESWHPDFQGDALELDRFLDRIWTGVDAMPHLERAAPHERTDLIAGDLPLFMALPDSRDLFTSRGERVADFFPASGLECVRARIAKTSDVDLAQQLWFVRASLSTLALEDERLQWPLYPEVANVSTPSRAELDAQSISFARAAGDLLERIALRDGRHVAWVGLDFSEKRWGMMPLADDLYGGAPGVALFLGYLGALTGEERYTALARDAIEGFRAHIEKGRSNAQALGAFGGVSGALYVFSHCHALWGDERFLAEIDACLDVLAPLIERDQDLDVIGGSAGAAIVLLGLWRRRADARVLELVRLCGEHLAASAREQSVGVGWFTKLQTERPVTGFSHGAAGIAWALAEIAAVTGETRWRDLALAGIANESLQYVPEAGNWRDAVDPRTRGQPGGESTTALSMAWCYGAPGIALSRLALSRTIDHPQVRADLATAVNSTRARGFGRNHSLCHGDLGNLDVLAQVARETNDAELAAHIDAQLARTLTSMRRDGFCCGVPLSMESPGLMNGIAGIGYGLLRQAAPNRVPSVLALDPPRS